MNRHRARALVCLMLAALLALTGCSSRPEDRSAASFAPDEEHLPQGGGVPPHHQGI